MLFLENISVLLLHCFHYIYIKRIGSGFKCIISKMEQEEAISGLALLNSSIAYVL